jgi:hypothetical protein
MFNKIENDSKFYKIIKSLLESDYQMSKKDIPEIARFVRIVHKEDSRNIETAKLAKIYNLLRENQLPITSHSYKQIINWTSNGTRILSTLNLLLREMKLNENVKEIESYFSRLKSLLFKIIRSRNPVHIMKLTGLFYEAELHKFKRLKNDSLKRVFMEMRTVLGSKLSSNMVKIVDSLIEDITKLQLLQLINTKFQGINFIPVIPIEGFWSKFDVQYAFYDGNNRNGNNKPTGIVCDLDTHRFGNITVKLNLFRDVLSGKILTEFSSSRDELLKHLPGLQSKLEARGLGNVSILIQMKGTPVTQNHGIQQDLINILI